MKRLKVFLAVAAVITIAMTSSLVLARPGGGFGRSGGFGHSFGGGGGSFGSHGSFGTGSSSFGRSSGGSFSRSSSSSSFGRSGSFGSSGMVHSTSIRPSYFGSRPVNVYRSYYMGGYYPSYYYGGWSDYSFYWMHPSWYYWMPFHPAFFYGPPVLYNGVMYPGDFSFFRLFLAILIFAFIIWLLVKIFGGGRSYGGGRRLKYTSYE